jgi:hypothetical protein
MSQIIANGGIFTGQSDSNNNPVIMGFIGTSAPPSWVGPVLNKAPANLSSVAGVTAYPASVIGVLVTDPTNCGNGSTYYNVNGTTLATTRYVLIAGTWTGG